MDRYLIYTDTVEMPVVGSFFDVFNNDIALKKYIESEKNPILYKITSSLAEAESILDNYIPAIIHNNCIRKNNCKWIADIAIIVKDLNYQCYDDFPKPNNSNIICCKVRECDPDETDDDFCDFPIFRVNEYLDEAKNCDDFDAFVAKLGYSNELDEIGKTSEDILNRLKEIHTTQTISAADLVKLAGGKACLGCRYNISTRTIEGWINGRPMPEVIRYMLARELGILRIWTSEETMPCW